MRKTIFTILANGGTPSGYTCPIKTTEFRIIRIINIAFFIGLVCVDFIVDFEFIPANVHDNLQLPFTLNRVHFHIPQLYPAY